MDLFTSLAIVLGLAAVGGIAARFFKQPVVLGYLIAGIIISASGIKIEKNLIDLMGQMGVTLLLFLVGLELPLIELKRIGKVAVTTGLGQIFITAIIGFGLVLVLGFPMVAALYISVCLTFSSTIIVVKLLSEKGDLQSLHGKISLGSLLVQDFVAIGILILLSAVTAGRTNLVMIPIIVVKGFIIVAGIMWLSDKLVPRLAGWLAKSTETLFISSIGWCLTVATLVASKWIGFNLEIGGLLAGLALANAVETLQITARIRPLRDFFITLFFISLGANVKIFQLGGIIWPTLVLTVFVVVGKPLLMMVIMNRLGYKKRTAFLSGVNMGQISEFSLIVIAAAASLGLVGQPILSVVTLVGIISMVCGTYLITNGDNIYKRIKKYLPYKENNKIEIENGTKLLSDHIVLFGYNRIGIALRPALEKLGKPLLIVDFNPEVVEKLKGEGLNVVYGDAADNEIYPELGLKTASLIVSTISDIRDTKLILSEIKSEKRKPIVIVTAADKDEATQLYTEGADLVIIPHSVGGEYLAGIFDNYGINRESIAKKGEQHLLKLKKL